MILCGNTFAKVVALLGIVNMNPRIIVEQLADGKWAVKSLDVSFMNTFVTLAVFDDENEADKKADELRLKEVRQND